METIRVTWGVNVTSGTEKITLDQLECETMQEWLELSEEEQEERLQAALDELPERTCMVVDRW